MPIKSIWPRHGWVSSTTPTAARIGQRFWPPRPRLTATPSGPRNSNALAVPNGSLATAHIKNSVTAAVTTPSAIPVSRPARLKPDSRGRTTTSSKTPAQANRSHAVPNGPSCPISPTDTASPSWTHVMDARAMEAPARELEKVMFEVDDAKSSMSTC